MVSAFSRESTLELQSAIPDSEVHHGLFSFDVTKTRKSRTLAFAGVCGILVVGFAAAFFAGQQVCSSGRGSSQEVAAEDLDDGISPEGAIRGTFSMHHDFRGRSRYVVESNGAVASDHGRCADQGVETLKKGGNAVDAAVVTALCQGLYNPMASGIGGGHIMILRLPDGSAEVIDARETAPQKAHKTMFRGRPDLSLRGGKAIAVPLELQGLYLAHSRHGSLKWTEVLTPAIELAENGFPAHPYLISALQSANFSGFEETERTFLVYEEKSQSYRIPEINETCCVRRNLANVLRKVGKEGPDALYKGEYASLLAKDIQEAGGIITVEDLRDASAVVKQPLTGEAFGVEFLLPPPPSSAVTVFLALKMLEGYHYPLAGSGSVGIHRQVEALKHAFALRMSLGDPGSVDSSWSIPNFEEIIGDMMNCTLCESLRELISEDGVRDISEYGGKWNVLTSGVLPEDHGTSHMSIVDPSGMAVALTSTVNTGFGSKVMSQSTGILLNNQMDDFSTPSQKNVYGIPASPSNFIYAGKKPFSSMSPMILQRNSRLRLVLGASGGPRIISAVFLTVLRLLAYGEDLFTGVMAPRIHHQLVPEKLYFEQWNTTGLSFMYDSARVTALKEKFGHPVEPTNWGAVVQAIQVDHDLERSLYAVSDARKDGAPAGF